MSKNEREYKKGRMLKYKKNGNLRIQKEEECKNTKVGEKRIQKER